MHSKEHKNRTEESIVDILDSEEYLGSSYSFPVGKDSKGEWHFIDLIYQPSALITGSVKDVTNFIENILLVSLIYQNEPEDLGMFLVGQRKDAFKNYKDLEHLHLPILKEDDDIASQIVSLKAELDKRYDLLDDYNVSNLHDLNLKSDKTECLLLVIDQLSDVTSNKQLEEPLVELLKRGKDVGIYVVIGHSGTEKDWSYPIVDNVFARIDFFYPNSSITSSELRYTWANHVGEYELQAPPNLYKTRYQWITPIIEDKETDTSELSNCQNCGHDPGSCDFEETFRRAIEMIAFKKVASNAMLQRELKIGYATSSRIIDQLEEEGLIGPAVGSEPRMISPKLFSLVENYKHTDNPLTCPMCQSKNIADIEYGMYEVTPELEKAEAEGRTVFAGCMMPKYVDEDGNEMTPEYHCNECLYEWEDGKEQYGLYAENEEDYEDEEE